MPQQCLSMSSCTRMHTVMKEHYTVCQHSMPFVLNGPTQFFLVFRSTLPTLLWSLVAWIPPSALLSYPRKQVQSAFWQADISLNFFGFSGECVHALLWLLFGFNIHKWNPVSSPVTRTMWSSSLWYRSKKRQSRRHSLHFEHFWNPPCTKLVTA
jgi:hypothetical protein